MYSKMTAFLCLFLFFSIKSMDVLDILLKMSTLWTILFAVHFCNTRLCSQFIIEEDIDKIVGSIQRRRDYNVRNFNTAIEQGNYKVMIAFFAKALHFSLQEAISNIENPKERAIIGFSPLIITLSLHMFLKW